MAMAATDRLDIKALTVSVGNLPLAVTEKNARMVRDWANRPEIPVYAGYPRPLVREPIFADDVHGKTGMGFTHDAKGQPVRGQPYGWFVGWAVKDGRSVTFARLDRDAARQETPTSWRARDAMLAELPGLLDKVK